jgi:DNA-binding MarR family transcriptional regulator
VQLDRPDLAEPGVSSRLDDQLCFALYAATNAIQRTYAPLLKALGLTYLQYLVLLVLWEHDGQRVGDIGRALYLDSGTLTPLLRRLERRGLVDRRRDAADEREVRIVLTSDGRGLEPQLAAVRSAVACQTALRSTALVELRSDLRRLRDQLARSAPTG